MNNNTDLLRGFFGAYFHQDWELDAANTQEVVAQYVEVSTPEERRVLSQAILEYGNRFTDDRELEEALVARSTAITCRAPLGSPPKGRSR